MPAFNINSFLSTIGDRGVLKTTRAEVTFPLPLAFEGDEMAQYYWGIAQDSPFFADATSLPGVVLQTMKFRRYGYGMFDTAAFTPNFNDVQVRFITDGLADNWKFFNAWINKIVAMDSSGGMLQGSEVVNRFRMDPYETAYQDDISTTMAIVAFAESGDAAVVATVNNAFPTAISEIKTDWGDTGDVARFVVNFNIQDFTLSPIGLA